MNNVKHHPQDLTSETSKTLVLSTSSYSMHQFTEIFTVLIVVKIMKHVRESMQGNLILVLKNLMEKKCLNLMLKKKK